MRKSGGLRQILLLLAVCFPLLASPAMLLGQAAQANSKGTMSTVSVASLRVTAKAREQFEKAKKADREHREEDYQREIQKVIDIAPEFSEVYLFMANRENREGEYSAAVAHSLRAQELDPASSWASVVLATAYNGENQFDSAFMILDNLRGDGSTSWQAKYEMARAEVGRRHAASAVHWGELALRSAPETFLDARLVLANALQLANRWREASEQMEFYLASNLPLRHREPVETALAHTRMMAAQQENER